MKDTAGDMLERLAKNGAISWEDLAKAMIVYSAPMVPVIVLAKFGYATDANAYQRDIAKFEQSLDKKLRRIKKA